MNDSPQTIAILKKIERNTAVLAKFEKAMASATRKYPVKPITRIGTGRVAYLPAGPVPGAYRKPYGGNSFLPGNIPVAGRAEKVRSVMPGTGTQRLRDSSGRFTKAIPSEKTGTVAAERRAAGNRPVSQSGTTPAIQQSKSADLLNQRRVKKQNTWLAGAIGKAVAKAGGIISRAKDFIAGGAPTSATDAAGMAAGGPFWAAAKELADAAGTTKDNRFLKAGFDKIAGAFGGKKAEKPKDDKRDDQGRFLKAAVQPGKKSILKDVRDHEQAEKTTEAIERVIEAIEKADKADARRSYALLSASRGGAAAGSSGPGIVEAVAGGWLLNKVRKLTGKFFGKKVAEEVAETGLKTGTKVAAKSGFIGKALDAGKTAVKTAGDFVGNLPGVKTAAAVAGGVGAKVVSSIAQNPAVKSVSKAIGESAIVQGAKNFGKSGMEMLGKGGAKGSAKTIEKAAGKSALKKLPGVGAAMGAAFAIDRAIDGDYVGAAGELTSGLVSIVPIVGTVASVAIDGLLLARDLMKEGIIGGENMPVAKGGKTATSDAEFFEKMGWTKEQAAGISANIQAESSGNHKAEGDKDENGVYRAYGLAQWHKPRQEAFKEWAGKDIRESSREEQLKFIDHELRNGEYYQKAGRHLERAKTAASSAEIVSDKYEVPHDPDGSKRRYRKALAGQILSDRKEEIAKVEATVTGPMAVSAGTVAVGGVVSESTGDQAKTVGAIKPVSPMPAVKEIQEAPQGGTASTGNARAASKGQQSAQSAAGPRRELAAKKDKNYRDPFNIPTEYDDSTLTLMAYDRI